MDFEKSVAALVAAAESVVDQCLVPVPAMPLMQMGEAVAGMESVETANDDHPIWALMAACDDVSWSFYPEWQFSSPQAIVYPYGIQELAEALAEYRQAIGE